MREIPGVSGGAIMPDGRVGLILDVSSLVKLAASQTVDLDADEQDEAFEEDDLDAKAAELVDSLEG